jgi:hypothetical protein
MSEEHSNNVIRFPKTPEAAIVDNIAEFNENFTIVRLEKDTEIADELYEISLNVLQSYGFFHNTKRANIKDLMFLPEVFKSAMLRYSGIDYPLQQFVDKYFQIEGEDYPEGVDPDEYFAKKLEEENEQEIKDE